MDKEFLKKTNNINVEEIMAELYKNLESRYEGADIQNIEKNFEKNANLINVSYQFKELHRNIEDVNLNWLTFVDVDISNQVFYKKYPKKILRKLTRWVFKDSLERQNHLNGATVRALNELTSLLAEQIEISNELKKQLVKFESMNNKKEG